MDKIGEANKPFEAREEDLLEVERRKEDDEKSVVVYQPKDVDAIDTSAFIKTKMQYGLDRVFWLADPVHPGEEIPEFLCPGLVADQEELVTSEMFAGKSLLLFFYPKDFGPEGEACLDVMAELATAPELDMELVAVSTYSLEVHRVWKEKREAGARASWWWTGLARWRAASGSSTPQKTSPTSPLHSRQQGHRAG